VPCRSLDGVQSETVAAPAQPLSRERLGGGDVHVVDVHGRQADRCPVRRDGAEA